MSAPLNVFPNARSRLFGAGEDSEGIIVTPAVAGLTGSVANSEESDNILINRNTVGSSVAVTYKELTLTPSVEVDVATDTLTIPTATSTEDYGYVLIGAIAGSAGGNATTATIRLFFDDAEVSSRVISFDDAGGSGERKVTSAIVVKYDPKVTIDGSIAVKLTIEPSVNGLFLQSSSLSAIVIKLTDDHAGIIDTVAIAGKQINTPDSHRTREQAVLPG